MANFRGVNNTKAQSGPSFVPIADGAGGGRLAAIYDEYTIPASGFAAADTITLGPPKALRAVDTVLDCLVSWAALGASVTMILGDDGDADRYITSVSVTSAGSQRLNAFTTGHGYKLTQDRELLITLAGAAPTPAALIKVQMLLLRP